MNFRLAHYKALEPTISGIRNVRISCSVQHRAPRSAIPTMCEARLHTEGSVLRRPRRVPSVGQCMQPVISETKFSARARISSNNISYRLAVGDDIRTFGTVVDFKASSASGRHLKSPPGSEQPVYFMLRLLPTSAFEGTASYFWF